MKYVRKEGRVWIIAAIAPDGNIWNASDTHEYVAATYYTKPSAADVDKAMGECLKLGHRPCDIEDCEWCAEE